MLAPAILPLQLTITLFLILGVVAIIVLPGRGYSSRKVLASVCVGSIILFCPSCIGVSFIVDLFRYGKFNYSSPAEITDPYIRLPLSATDVTVFKYTSGHDARFAVSHDNLVEWVKDQHAKAPNSVIKYSGPSHDPIPAHFSNRGWIPVEHMEKHSGPYAPNGAGFSVWYSEQHGIAYLHAGYW